MTELQGCTRCDHQLEILRHPLRRLRWTQYWWKGVVSLFTGPLRVCPQCGAIYSGDGDLLGVGAVMTDVETDLDQYRKDMAHLRDSFGGVIIASELVAVWLVAGPVSFHLAQVILAGAVGVGSFIPFAYFASKARHARRDLKQLTKARRSGYIPGRRN